MIHPTAIVGKKAQIGQNVSIGPFTVVYDDVVVGEETTIEGHCEIGYPSPLAERRPLILGKASHIRSHSVFYGGSTFGERLVTGHRVTVRENIAAGANLQIGTLSDLQGDCQIGDFVRTHSNVFIPKHAKIGNFVWMLPHVVLTNDPHPPSDWVSGVTVEDFAVIAAGAVILPGVTVGPRSLVAAGSLVHWDVPADTVVAGVPAKKLCATSEIQLKDGTGRSAYPWPRHFRRGYPEAIVREWGEEYP
jgi:acetyltransferase-like isoleucine patch superfamily enzyme